MNSIGSLERAEVLLVRRHVGLLLLILLLNDRVRQVRAVFYHRLAVVAHFQSIHLSPVLHFLDRAAFPHNRTGAGCANFLNFLPQTLSFALFQGKPVVEGLASAHVFFEPALVRQRVIFEPALDRQKLFGVVQAGPFCCFGGLAFVLALAGDSALSDQVDAENVILVVFLL